MRRRDFVTFLSAATAWVAAARAQESKKVIGVLSSVTSDSYPGLDAGLIRGLENTGFIEGKNTLVSG